jgi:hypothetical protein
MNLFSCPEAMDLFSIEYIETHAHYGSPEKESLMMDIGREFKSTQLRDYLDILCVIDTFSLNGKACRQG